MSASGFVLCLALGAAALALWVEARFPKLGGTHSVRVACHLLAALLAANFLMPEVAVAVRDSGSPAAYPLAAVGVTLPALTYLFLASLWLLKLAQRMLPGVR